MKKITLSIALIAFTISVSGQTSHSPRSSATRASSHMPVQKTDAGLEIWVKQYPQEAAAHAKDLQDRMRTADQKTAAGQQEYGNMKAELNHLNDLMRKADAARATSPKGN